ncbi:MAG: sulfate/molybdate ABC transporter ATP-binding protein [Saprospiraceae bacterium]
MFSSTGELTLQLDLQVQAGERIAILGPSGSGKTTLLRMLAGLTKPDSGHIIFNTQIWFDAAKKINRPPQQRRVGLMFQEYALFPNMTVRQNLEYAAQKPHKQVVKELIDIVELNELVDRYPNTLSGGQQQRVALARALAAEPQLLLLDEPLSALDADMRERLQQYIITLQHKYQLTTIWVTHSEEEVRKVAQRVLLLQNGMLTEQSFGLKSEEYYGIIQHVKQKENQQLVTIVLNAKEKNTLAAGKTVTIRVKD